MKTTAFLVGLGLGLAGILPASALEIQEDDGVYEIVDGGKVVGTFWNPQTAGSDVKFSAEKGTKPEIFWSRDHRYLAANGAGSATDHQLYLYEVGDGRNWTPVAPGSLTDEQLAPLNEIKDWAASGTEAVRWEDDDTLLMRVWSKGPAKDGAAPETASIWANLKVTGAKSEVVGTSTTEPMTPDAAAEATKGAPSITAPPGDSEKADDESAAPERRLDPQQFVGEHSCTGRNADGTEYEGRVTIRAKGGLLLFQWTVGKTVTHGTGLIADMTVGVALDNGVAIYQAVPQTDGISLVGLWKPQGAKKAMEETIFVGNADTTNADFAVRDVDGEWDFVRDLPGDKPMDGVVKISGGDVVKKLKWQFADGSMDGEGLLLSDGLAVITEEGLAVYAIVSDDGGKEFFSGESVNGKGQIFKETLTPAK